MTRAKCREMNTMRRLLWATVCLTAFLLLFVAATFAAETMTGPPRPGLREPRDRGGMGRGLLTTAFALFGARYLANRITPIGHSRHPSAPDKQGGG